MTVGQSKTRLDAEEKVTGKAIYTMDIKLPGMVYGKVLRSPLAHATIAKVDASKARGLRNVVAVLTRDDLSELDYYFGWQIRDQPLVAIDKVRYEGDIVAAAVAVYEETAEEALSLIEVEYEELPKVFTVDEALARGAPLVHETLKEKRLPQYGVGATGSYHEGTNICYHFKYERGDIEQGFREADHVFEDIFHFPRCQHYSLEPYVSIAEFKGDTLTVWSSTQVPFAVQLELSKAFHLPLSKVRVIVPHVGAGYGCKCIKPEPLAAALARKAKGLPVKLGYSVEEAFKTLSQHEAKVRIKTGTKKDGTFVARECEVFLNTGAYADAGPLVNDKAGYRAHGPYRIPHVRTNAYAVYTNTVPAGPFRGFGGTQVAWAYESQMDIIAKKLNIDALELRLKNLLERGEEFAPGDTPIDSDLKKGLKLVAEAIGWHMKTTARNRGKGLSCTLKDGGGPGKPASASVKIVTDGSIVLSFGTVEIGQGIKTALSQVVAEELEVPLGHIEVAQVDTSSSPFDLGAVSSSSVALSGLAVQRAAQDAKAQLLQIAAIALGVQVKQLTLKNGHIYCDGDQSISVREALLRYFGPTGGEIVGRGVYKGANKPEAPLGMACSFWEDGIAGAEVEVDEETGEIKILKYVSLTDAGKMINPILCRGQEEGAAMFGIGHTLFEEMVYHDGRLVNPNPRDYRIPNFRDMPEDFESKILEGGGGPGPYGAKGMGESGILPVASAVANAVWNAVGVRIKTLPLTGEKVWRALIAKQKVIDEVE
ncbi:MAG: aldehyde oxidase [Acidobacteria bacterium]|nr:MAG: aldehyde oxidase [Acidobacteriota bacterium]